MKSWTAVGLLLVLYYNNPLYGQAVGNLQISSHRTIHFIVTDPQGRRTGVDPRGAEDPFIGNELSEIPDANYSTNAIGDSPQNYEPLETDIQHEFMYNVKSPTNDGIYQIDCIGLRLGRFDLSMSLLLQYPGETKSFDTTLTGFVDVNTVVSFRMEYKGEQGGITRTEKIASSSILRQDLDNSFKLKFLGEQGFHKELSSILDSYEKHLSKKDTLKAVKELEKFQDRITKEYNKGTKSKDKRFITADAWEILYNDAQYVIEHLIPLPPKPTGTLLQQMDRLKAEVLQQQRKKNIGGSLLIKSLTLFSDQAKKQLLQGDSTKAVLSLRLFQLLVDETHELTEAIIAKKKPLPPVYVNDEAYIQLHYRAKYIFEALPEPRIDLHQHRLQTVDKELLKELESLKGMIEQK
jgi:hypothetical protein